MDDQEKELGEELSTEELLKEAARKQKNIELIIKGNLEDPLAEDLVSMVLTLVHYEKMLLKRRVEGELNSLARKIRYGNK